MVLSLSLSLSFQCQRCCSFRFGTRQQHQRGYGSTVRLLRFSFLLLVLLAMHDDRGRVVYGKIQPTEARRKERAVETIRTCKRRSDHHKRHFFMDRHTHDSSVLGSCSCDHCLHSFPPLGNSFEGLTFHLHGRVFLRDFSKCLGPMRGAITDCI